MLLTLAGPYTPTLARGHGMSDQSISSTVVYKDIPGFPGYRVGNDGSVWSIKAKGGNNRTAGRLGTQWKSLSQCLNANGYACVNLFHEGTNYIKPVHHLVLEAFVGPKPDGMEGCHYPDSDKSNNRLENLRWDSQQENAKDRWRDRALLPTRVCRKCGLTKPVEEMSKDKRKPDGLAVECKKCMSARSYACSNKEKRRAAHRRWLAKKKGVSQ